MLGHPASNNGDITTMAAETRFIDLELKKIVVPENRKKSFNKNDEKLQLAINDIEIAGFLEPIGVRPMQVDKYELLYGRKRLWIAKHLGYDTIPAVIKEGVADNDVDFLTFSENVHRSQMKPGEYLRYVQKLARAREKANVIELGRAVGGASRAQNGSRERGRFARIPKAVPPDNRSPKDPGLSTPPTEATSVAGDEPSKVTDEPTTFAKALAKKTGKTEREALREATAAKVLTPEQLQKLDEANASKEDMIKIAKIHNDFLRHGVVAMFCDSKGTQPVDQIIADCGGSPTSVKLEAAPEENTMPDAQWLETYCVNLRSQLQDTNAFDQEALLYRATRAERAKFAQKIKGAAGKVKAKGGYRPFANLMLKLAFIEHPGD
jgi:ParB/RepB/Spo0J family partition protein